VLAIAPADNCKFFAAVNDGVWNFVDSVDVEFGFAVGLNPHAGSFAVSLAKMEVTESNLRFGVIDG
jgi:hypothetical protein